MILGQETPIRQETPIGQAVDPKKKQENTKVDKTLTETIHDVRKSTVELQLQIMMQRIEQMELDK